MAAPIIVGFDGSPHSQVAVDWAAEEARLRQRRLLIIHSFLVLSPLATDLDSSRHEASRASVGDLVDKEVARIRDLNPDLEVSGKVVGGMSASIDLVEASEDGELLVVGSRGRGRFTSLLLGSTSTQVTAYSRCPVVVVRGPAPVRSQEPDRIVVGVDASPLSQAALRFAFEEASLREARLIAVHAWTHPVATESGDVLPQVYSIEERADSEKRVLAEALAGWPQKYPDVPVERVCERVDARQLLQEKSAGACLVVLGSRGHGGFTGLLLGSTTQAMVHHADAPVAVVHSSGAS
ncbi:universal stress protein [Stackebrandtia nassauensis]|uniref:UspA domain protein n=1 Tax=Stackebrandtia nassauensis (strain DSM 44728 / CIP 108903 / NRRL B-16338 / NBRC 102104 / LLR-40K-21) TaxID=446470 RepID=D3PVK1_STANL|nr:universal stress protein [Stackebrandtia nassauensis]ADD43115.1 UspA domain protein [Stackebrandtia nassauensis DSM 44728]